MADVCLKHHGILGQKWGVRRFQNKDGSYTDAGKKRYGIGEDSDSFVLKRGTSIYRVANQDDNLSDGRKRYYSVLEEDRDVYSNDLLKGLFLSLDKPVGEFKNSTEADLVVKKGESVIQDLIKQYGNEQTESLTRDFELNKELRKEISDKKARSEYLSGFGDDDDIYRQFEHEQARKHLDDFIWDTMKEHGDKIVDEYHKMGYDAIVDPYDYVMDIADMPIIVAQPDKTVKQQSFKRLR